MNWPILILSAALLCSSLYIWRLVRVIRRLRDKIAWFHEQYLGHLERTIDVEEGKWIAAFERLAAKKREVRVSLEEHETPEAETD